MTKLTNEQLSKVSEVLQGEIKVAKGDTIVVTDKKCFPMKDMTVGKEYEAVEVSACNDENVIVYDDVGDSATAQGGRYLPKTLMDYITNKYSTKEMYDAAPLLEEGTNVVVTSITEDVKDTMRDMTVGKVYEVIHSYFNDGEDEEQFYDVIDDVGDKATVRCGHYLPVDSDALEELVSNLEDMEYPSTLGEFIEATASLASEEHDEDEETWEKGDKVREKTSGRVVEVFAFKPKERTYGEGKGFPFMASTQGFTFIDNDDFESWAFINGYEKIVEEEPTDSIQKAKVGDTIKIKTYRYGAQVGAIRTVIEENFLGLDGVAYRDEDSGSGKFAARHGDYEIISRADDVEEDTEEVHEQEVKPGDMVEITAYQLGDDVGTVAEVLNVLPTGSVEYKSEKSNTSTFLAGKGSFKVVKSSEEAGIDDKFTVGTLVKGLENDYYRITDGDMLLAIVTKGLDQYGEIEVKVLAHRTMPEEVGKKYEIETDHLEIVPQEEEAILSALGLEKGKLYETKNEGEFMGIEEGKAVFIDNVEMYYLMEEDEYFIEAMTPYGVYDWFRHSDLTNAKEDEQDKVANYEEGDFVVGVANDLYLYADEDMTLAVVESVVGYGSERIRVKVLSHKSRKEAEGKSFTIIKGAVKHLEDTSDEGISEALGLKMGGKYRVLRDGEFGDILEDSIVTYIRPLTFSLKEGSESIRCLDDRGEVDYFRPSDLEEYGIENGSQEDNPEIFVGDIVKVVDGDFILPKGAIVEVVGGVDSDGHIKVRYPDEVGNELDTHFLFVDEVTIVVKSSDREDI